MSRFSKSKAESQGWVFVHSSHEEEIVESATQGRTRTTPASNRAEKRLDNGALINEEAETLGLLLERISKYEATREQLTSKKDEPTVVTLTDVPHTLDDDGQPEFAIRTVRTHDGDITEAERAGAGSVQFEDDPLTIHDVAAARADAKAAFENDRVAPASSDTAAAAEEEETSDAENGDSTDAEAPEEAAESA